MSKPTYKRSARIGDQMKEEIADILMRKIKDPRIGFATVTDVVVADDLRNATVFVSVYGSDRKDTLAGMVSASSFIRSELGRRMRLRSIPELLFRYDDSAERGAHIMELLHDIEDEEGTKGSGDA
jgi:ribosome-binding factor A